MKRPTAADPFAALWLGWKVWFMLLESQQIIAMRMAGMAGLRPANTTEPTVMVAEKMRAASDSIFDASMAALRGAAPQTIAARALAPYVRRTHANARRLALTPRRRG